MSCKGDNFNRNLATELVNCIKTSEKPNPFIESDNFDSHYKKDIEPILVIEETIERLVKSGYEPKKAYLVGQSLKYILRAGLKDGENIEKDIFKAFNYLHRSIRGVWDG